MAPYERRNSQNQLVQADTPLLGSGLSEERFLVTVVVPALNEEKNLRQAVVDVVNSAKRAGDVPIEIIVVNDGSTDRTGDVVRGLEKEFPNVRGVHHEKNRGLGSTLVDGLRMAKYEKICLFPGDAAVHPYTMENIFRNAHKADMLLAYIVNTETRSTMRVALSSMFTRIYSLTFNVHLRYINGAPLYTIAKIRDLDLKAERYSLLAEIHVKLIRQGATFMEVDGYLKHGCKKSSAIKLNSLREVIRSYFRLVNEVYFRNPDKYRKTPIRVHPYDA